MMGIKIVITVLAVAIAACAPNQLHCAASTTSATTADRRELISRLSDETVAMVRFLNPGTSDPGPVVYCGGVWVTERRFVTASHCPADEDYIAVETRSDADSNPPGWHMGKVVRLDTKNDLALIETDYVPPHPIAHLATVSSIYPGDPLHVIGHVTNHPWSYRQSAVSAFRPSEENPGGNLVDSIQIDGSVYHGDSGSGAFDETGALVGIVVYVFQNGPFMATYIVAPNVVANFLATPQAAPASSH